VEAGGDAVGWREPQVWVALRPGGTIREARLDAGPQRDPTGAGGEAPQKERFLYHSACEAL